MTPEAVDHKTLTLTNAWELAQYIPDGVRNALSPLFDVVVLGTNTARTESASNPADDLFVTNPLGISVAYPYNDKSTRLIADNNLDGLLWVDTAYATQQGFTTELVVTADVVLADKSGKTALRPAGVATGKASYTSAAAEALSGVFGGRPPAEASEFQKATQDVSRQLAASIKDKIAPHLQ